MMHKTFILCLAILSLVAVKADADDLTSIQQRQLISNINYLQYSTAKIRISENKAIAEDIYYSIINELKIEYINNKILWALEPDEKKPGKVKIINQEHAAELVDMATDWFS